MCECKYTQMHMKCDSVSCRFSGALAEILPCFLTGSVGSHDVWWWVIAVICSCVSCPLPICSPRNSLRDLKIASPCLMPLINICFANLTVQELQILVPNLVLKSPLWYDFCLILNFNLHLSSRYPHFSSHHTSEVPEDSSWTPPHMSHSCLLWSFTLVCTSLF